MDPLPEINRVFHLVAQEENQKGQLSNNTDSALAFAFQGDKSSKANQPNQKSQPSRRGRPFCTHCNIHGHTVERCYKLHGYPPGYNKSNKPKDAVANQVQSSEGVPNSTDDAHTLLPQLNAAQYQQLLNLLANQ